MVQEPPDLEGNTTLYFFQANSKVSLTSLWIFFSFSGGFTPNSDRGPSVFVKNFDKFQDEDTVSIQRVHGHFSGEHTLIFSCLPFQIRKQLSDAFADCGEVVNVRIPTDRETGQIKG